MPQLRQVISDHPIVTTFVVMIFLLVLFGLYAMGFTQASGGIGVRR